MAAEAGDESSHSSASATQRCNDSDAALISATDVKFLPRDGDSTAATPTSGHVTAANEHDHMVSSTIHSDG